ncbi:MAG: hypothetical protein JRJ38_07105 [Deltaproteobacteria bacterium]|nr:hypothetical protein [Deltaproteobacteria bacterium]
MDSLINKIDEFESDLRNALEFKYQQFYGEHWQQVLENNTFSQMSIREFAESYAEQPSYPLDRIQTLVYLLFDFKIELFFIIELDMGLYNHLIYNLGYDNSSIAENPYILLRRLSLDQTVIVKSRILWERTMNFVYFLETGVKLEASGRKSKKAKFFKLIEENQWSFLLDYKDYIEWFDDKLRTPEVHKSSTLRKAFQGGSHPPSEKVDAFVNIIMNVFWRNMLSIIKGNDPPVRYWNAGIANL